METQITPISPREERRNVAIYIRVSTLYQVDKDSLPMQRKDLIAYCELILGTSDYVIFEDAGYSGKNTDRPAYQEMITRIRNREFTHLLVWKIDRISRNLLDFSELYMELKKLHVVFVSKNEQFDTSSAVGEAMLKIILVFAELERNMTSERVTATMISRASQGQWNGGRIPYGYSYDRETGQFSVLPDEASVCIMMKDFYLSNRSVIKTVNMVNEKGIRTRGGKKWSAISVHKILASPFYTGVYRYNYFRGGSKRTVNPAGEWIKYENHHPAIFTEREHEEICLIMQENKRTQNTPEQTAQRVMVHVFSGICFCGKCGCRMIASPGRLYANGYRGSTYTCSSKRNRRGCDNQSVNDSIIGEFVVNYLSNIVTAKKSFSNIQTLEDLQRYLLRGGSFENIQSINKDGLQSLFDIFGRYPSASSFRLIKGKRKSPENPELAALKKELAKQKRALSRLRDLYLYSEDSIPRVEYMSRYDKINAQIVAISAKLELYSATPDDSLSDEDFIQKASYLLITTKIQNAEYINYRHLAETTSPAVLKEFLQSIISRIQVCGKNVKSISFKNGMLHSFRWKN